MVKNYVLMLLAFLVVTLEADVKDKWKIDIGTMFVTNFDTEMQLSPKRLPLAVRIDTKDQLGMTSDTNVLRLDGYYRFTDTHSMDFSYFSVRSSGNKTIGRSINWNNAEISAGASVDSMFDMTVYKLNYGYSFYHNEKIELALTAGLHITTLDVGLDAKGIVNGIPGQTYSSGEYATMPLPVFGFKGQYTIVDNTLFFNYKTEYFFIQFDDYEGSFTSSAVSLEYRFMENVGVGTGYNTNNIYVKMEDGNKKIEVDNTLSGFMLYLSYTY